MHTLPNGEQVPVRVSTAPVNNGESSNNVDLKDMSPMSESSFSSAEEQRRIVREQIARMNRNRVELSVMVLSKRVNRGALVMEKDASGNRTTNPRLDEHGNEMRYADTYFATFSFRGGSKEYPVTFEIYDALEIGNEYFMKGYTGAYREFGQEKIGAVWSSLEYL